MTCDAVEDTSTNPVCLTCASRHAMHSIGMEATYSDLRGKRHIITLRCSGSCLSILQTFCDSSLHPDISCCALAALRHKSEVTSYRLSVCRYWQCKPGGTPTPATPHPTPAPVWNPAPTPAPASSPSPVSTPSPSPSPATGNPSGCHHPYIPSLPIQHLCLQRQRPTPLVRGITQL